MKWSRLLTLSLTVALAAVVGVRAEAKDQATSAKTVSKTNRRPAAANKTVSLDDIELDEDVQPVKAKAPVKKLNSAKPAAAKPAPSQSETLDSIALDGDEAVAPSGADAVTTSAIEKAKAFEEKKQFADVIKTLKPLVAQLPRHGLLMLARAYRASGDTQGELHLLETLVAKNPKDYVVQTQIGDTLAKLKRTDDAIAAYQAAKTVNKNYRPAYDGIWALLEDAHDKYEARALLLDMVKVFGPSPKTSTALCRMYSTEDFLEQATSYCRAAVTADPKMPDNYVHLGLSLRDQEKSDEASKVLSDAAKRFPASEWAQSAAGDLKLSQKDFIDSYLLYKQGTVADPKSVRSWVGFAKSAHELQKYDEAISGFVKACRLDRRASIHLRQASFDLQKSKNIAVFKKYQAAELTCDP